MIEVKKIYKTYKSKKGDICKPVKDVSLTFDNKGLVFILGDSGSGKTTLLNVMSGIDSFDEGSISIYDNKIEKMSQKQLDILRRQDIAVVFQSYNLLEELNVYDNIAITLRLLKINEQEIKKRVDEVLIKLGLENLEKRNINELSGGQKQRVAIARAIIKKSKVIFMDEPTGNLDSENSEKIFEEIKNISKECLIVVVTHNIKMAHKYGNEIIKIKDGKIESKESNSGTLIKNIKYCDNTGEEIILNKKITIEDLLLDHTNIDETQDKVTLSIKIDYYDNDKKEDIDSNKIVINEKENELNIKKTASLRLLDRIILSLKVFKSKKKQLIYTAIILSIAFIMTVFTTYIYTYDYKETVYMYLKDNNIKNVELYKSLSYINKLNEKVENQVKNGKTIKNDLEDIFSKDKLEYYKEFNEVTSENGEGFDSGVIVTSKHSFDEKLLCGDFGNSYKDVVISETLSDSLYGKHDKSVLEKKIICDEIILKITGICEYRGYGKEQENRKFIIANEKIFMNYTDVKNIGINGGDLRKGNTLKTFISSYAEYGKVGDIKEEYLIKGRMPKKEKEVLISSSMIEDIDEYFDSENEVSYRIRDVFGETNDTYGVINMHDYFPEGVVVVGIVDADKMEEYGIEKTSEFYVCEKIYNNILDDYSKFYWYDGVKYNGELTYDNLNALEQKNIFIDETGCEYIYDTNSWIKEMSKIILFMDVSVAILFIVSMLSYVHNIIRKNAKQVGILRSIGTPIKDIIYIYEQNSFILTMLCIIISYPIIKWMVKVINISMRRRFIGETKIVMFQNNSMLMIVCALGFIAVNFVLSLFPIIRMSKKTPAKLLYDIN